jgi:hypothetical protein
MASRGIWRLMSARARRGLALSWTTLFVLSLLLQYFTFATASGARGPGITVDLDQWSNQPPAALARTATSAATTRLCSRGRRRALPAGYRCRADPRPHQLRLHGRGHKTCGCGRYNVTGPRRPVRRRRASIPVSQPSGRERPVRHCYGRTIARQDVAGAYGALAQPQTLCGGR